MRKSRLAAASAAAVMSLAALTACGSSDSDSADSAQKSSSTAGKSSSSVPKPSTAAPTEIPITEPLTRKPPTGKTIAVAYCALPVCAGYNSGFKAAAAALGWNAKLIQYDITNPQKGLQQAIDLNPDYVVIGGPPRAAIAAPLAAAKKKGIPVIDHSTVEDADPAAGFYAQPNGAPSAAAEMKDTADWVINDSGDKADAVLFGAFEYPLQAVSSKSMQDEFAKCSGCKFDKQPLTTAEIGSGGVPAKIVAYLQSHPSVNYVVFAFGDPTTGVTAALKAAGLDKRVKVVVDENSTKSVTKELAGGTMAAVSQQPIDYMGWAAVDSAARLSVGMSPPDPATGSVLPAWLQDTAESANQLGSSGQFPGPTGFEDAFKKLWKVNG
jgi:ribose transport system substrate-binding protein